MKAKLHFIFILVVATVGRAENKKIDLGGLLLEVSDSRTAQVFHIVDQLSQWDTYAHKQYVRWANKELTLDQTDRDLLQKHTELRKKRGWGAGFEQSFIVDDPIEQAAAKAIAAQKLTADEANAERDILLHFSVKLQPLIDQKQRDIETFEQQLLAEKTRLIPLVAQLAHFSEVKDPPTFPVFLVANPDERSSGGEANGGRLVVEVPGTDAMDTLLHESLHRLLAPQRAAIEEAAKAGGLDFETLNEGIAYALSPGLTADPKQGDPLVEWLVRMQLRGTPASDHYMQFSMLAVVIRPLLKSALARNETITTFLPAATQKWRSVAPH